VANTGVTGANFAGVATKEPWGAEIPVNIGRNAEFFISAARIELKAAVFAIVSESLGRLERRTSRNGLKPSEHKGEWRSIYQMSMDIY